MLDPNATKLPPSPLRGPADNASFGFWIGVRGFEPGWARKQLGLEGAPRGETGYPTMVTADGVRQVTG